MQIISSPEKVVPELFQDRLNRPPSRAEAWQWAMQVLVGSDSARLDSQLLICHALNINLASFMAWPEKRLNNADWQVCQQLIQRRSVGEPVAYIIGEQGFWALTLKTHTSTLIPRPETECLVEAVLTLPLPAKTRCIDLGTGTGAIALALAYERPQWQLLGVDQSIEAVELARDNGKLNNISNVQWQQGDWLLGIASGWHCIVSNPPYISPDDPHLQQGDVVFEPQSALVAKQQGLADICAIIEQSTQQLVNNGWLVLEHGYNQATKVREALLSHGFQQVQTHVDLNGQERVTLGRLSAINMPDANTRFK